MAVDCDSEAVVAACSGVVAGVVAALHCPSAVHAVSGGNSSCCEAGGLSSVAAPSSCPLHRKTSVTASSSVSLD